MPTYISGSHTYTYTDGTSTDMIKAGVQNV